MRQAAQVPRPVLKVFPIDITGHARIVDDLADPLVFPLLVGNPGARDELVVELAQGEDNGNEAKGVFLQD